MTLVLSIIGPCFSSQWPSHSTFLHISSSKELKQTGILGYLWWVQPMLWLCLSHCYCLKSTFKKGGIPALERLVLSAGLHPNSSSYGCKPHTAHKVISTVWGGEQVLLSSGAVVAWACPQPTGWLVRILIPLWSLLMPLTQATHWAARVLWGPRKE